MRSGRRPRRSRRLRYRLFAPAVAATLLAVGPAVGQQPRFEGDETVIGRQLMVELLDRHREPISAADRRLARTELELVVDGQPIGPRLLDVEARPDWQLVLYFDRQLAGAQEIAWAASVLGERALELTSLGDVEVVVAGPAPRRVVPATRETGLVEAALAQLALFRGDEASAVLALRDDFLAALGQLESAEAEEREVSPAELAALAVAEEARLIAAQQDRLAAWLLASSEPGRPRAVFWVTGGFDLRPADFYSAYGEEVEATDLTELTAATARLIGGDGWIVHSLVRPPFRTLPARWGLLRRIEVLLDGNRNPKKAAAYLELSREMREAGKLGNAERAARKALYHYYDDPKLAAERASAYVELGEILELAGRRLDARRAFQRAIDLEPELAGRYLGLAALLVEPRESLDILRRGTSGVSAASREELTAGLERLAGRLALPFQLAGEDRHRLIEVDVVGPQERRWSVRAPSHLRSGSPPELAELRLRRFLAGEPSEGELAVDLRERDAGGYALRLATMAADDRAAARWRLSIAYAGSPPRFEHRGVDLGEEAIVDVGEASGGRMRAVLLEDLVGGAWGIAASPRAFE